MTLDSSETLRSKLESLCDNFLPPGVITDVGRREFVSQLEQSLLHAKLESLAEFAAGAGHEINNPVATIVGRAQLLLAEESDPERRHALEIIGGQALRIRDMIGDTMLFARPPAPHVEQLDLLDVARRAVDSQANLQTVMKANVTIEVDAGTTIWADRTQLLVVLSSLVRNSLEVADRPNVHVRLTAGAELRDRARWVVVTVTDDGPGFSELDREHLFDPFYSGRQAGRGLGFGLSKCWRILQMHGGEITAKQADGHGAILETRWPIPTEAT